MVVPSVAPVAELRCRNPNCGWPLVTNGKIKCRRCESEVFVTLLDSKGKQRCPECRKKGKKPAVLLIDGKIKCSQSRCGEIERNVVFPSITENSRNSRRKEMTSKNEQPNVAVAEKLRGHSVGEIEKALEEISRWKVLDPKETRRIQLQSFFDLGLCDVMAMKKEYISECVPLPEKGRENPLLVIPQKILSFPTQMVLVGKQYRPGGCMWPYQIKDPVVNLVETPHNFYWLYDVSFFEVKSPPYIWISDRECMKRLAKSKKRGLTIEEALAYLVQNPRIIGGLSGHIYVLASRMCGHVIALEYDFSLGFLIHLCDTDSCAVPVGGKAPCVPYEGDEA